MLVGQVQWGDVPTWIASVGAILAFAAALVAIWLQRREFRTTERQRKQSQASGVSLEVGTTAMDTPAGHRFFEVTVHNASSAPIFGCSVHLGDGDQRGVPRAGLSIGTVPAGTSRTVHVVDEPDPYYNDLGFTDSDGNHWVRRWTGSLISVPLSPAGVIVPGPQMFQVADYLDRLPKGVAKNPELVRDVETWARETGLIKLGRRT